MDKTFDDNEFLWSQFIRLGEMLGDGDCDAWVGKEYKRVARQLGLVKNKPRKNNSKQIDEFMEKRITQVKCNKCNGELKQSRKGSFVGICTNCGTNHQRDVNASINLKNYVPLEQRKLTTVENDYVERLATVALQVGSFDEAVRCKVTNTEADLPLEWR